MGEKYRERNGGGGRMSVALSRLCVINGLLCTLDERIGWVGVGGRMGGQVLMG